MSTKKLVSERVENPFVVTKVTKKDVSMAMKVVNENKRAISEELKKERSFFGCLRYISRNHNEKFISDFFQSINSDFHKICIDVKSKEPVQVQIDYFNSIKAEALITRELLKPKTSYSVNYIVSVFAANRKIELLATVTTSGPDRAAKIAKLQAQIERLSKVA